MRTRPSWANTLVVGDGSEVNEKPRSLDADHVIVASLITSMPAEPGGVLTGERSVTGPLQVMSNETVAGVDTGSSNRSNAFGVSKKSSTASFVAVMRALPAPNWTSTPSGGCSATVQNNPPGYGVMPGLKSWTWVVKLVRSN